MPSCTLGLPGGALNTHEAQTQHRPMKPAPLQVGLGIISTFESSLNYSNGQPSLRPVDWSTNPPNDSLWAKSNLPPVLG